GGGQGRPGRQALLWSGEDGTVLAAAGDGEEERAGAPAGSGGREAGQAAAAGDRPARGGRRREPVLRGLRRRLGGTAVPGGRLARREEVRGAQGAAVLRRRRQPRLFAGRGARLEGQPREGRRQDGGVPRVRRRRARDGRAGGAAGRVRVFRRGGEEVTRGRA